jgi:hypothetical protein
MNEFILANASAIFGFAGTLLGVFISAPLTYFYQKKLLNQQLAFQEKQAEIDQGQRASIASEVKGVLENMRHILRDGVNAIGSSASRKI